MCFWVSSLGVRAWNPSVFSMRLTVQTDTSVPAAIKSCCRCFAVTRGFFITCHLVADSFSFSCSFEVNFFLDIYYYYLDLFMGFLALIRSIIIALIVIRCAWSETRKYVGYIAPGLRDTAVCCQTYQVCTLRCTPLRWADTVILIHCVHCVNSHRGQTRGVKPQYCSFLVLFSHNKSPMYH